MDREKIKKKLAFWYLLYWVLLFIALYLSYCVYFLDVTSTKSKWVILFASAMAVFLGACKYLEITFYKFADSAKETIIKEHRKTGLLFDGYKNILLVILLTIIFASGNPASSSIVFNSSGE